MKEVVEDFATIASMCCPMPGLQVGTRILLRAHYQVTEEVKSYPVIDGAPTKKLCMAVDIQSKDGFGPT